MSFFHRNLSEIDLKPLVSVSVDTSLSDVVAEFNKMNFGAFGVRDENNKQVGILSERDLLLRTNPNDFSKWSELKVSSIMSQRIFSLDYDKKVSDAIHMMSRMEFRHLPIKKDNEYFILSARILLDLIIEDYKSVCEKFGVLEDWVTLTGHIHEEDHLFLGKKDTLETGTFLFAPIKEVGGTDLLKIDGSTTVAELWQKMSESKLPIAAVSEWGTLLKGIITDRDFLTKVFVKDGVDLSKSITEIMTEQPHSMMMKHHIVYALNNMAKFRYRNILIVDEDKFPVLNAELIHFLKFFSKIIESSELADA